MEVPEEDVRERTAGDDGRAAAVYGVLGAIAVALPAMRYGDSPAEPLVGTTSQDAPFSMELDREGRAVRFDTQLIAHCPNGATWPVRWWEADSPRVPTTVPTG